MRVKLYESSNVFSFKGEDIETYLQIEIDFSIKDFFFFVVHIPNKSFCFRNPFTALIFALESEMVDSAKFVRLDEMR